MRYPYTTHTHTHTQTHYHTTSGTQARRTGSSSALGELFDHGCDSLFVTFSGMTLINTINATPWLAYFMISIVGVIPFWTSHWEEYHTGCLILGTLGNPTEAQLTLIVAQIVGSLVVCACMCTFVCEKVWEIVQVRMYVHVRARQ
jgi:phosphatidylglycerophosphate synthase